MENRYKYLRNNRAKDENCKSIRALARALNIAPTHISEIERGLRDPSFSELLKYHQYFGVSIEYLIGETDTDQPAIVNSKDTKIPESDLAESSTIAPDQKVYAEIKKIMDDNSKNGELIKQAVQFLFGTTTGKVVLNDLADVLFGISHGGEEDLCVLRNLDTHELNRIHNADMQTVGKRFVNALLLLRDPKYRKMRYNELKLILSNIESENIIEDDYSDKCYFEA